VGLGSIYGSQNPLEVLAQILYRKRGIYFFLVEKADVGAHTLEKGNQRLGRGG
jgi:hypothetical protein